MKYLTEYRDAKLLGTWQQKIQELNPKPCKIMEICGGQTHTILKYGIEQLLPKEVSLLHGPGCPVCVTPAEIVDQAINIAFEQNVIMCTFGDMLRVIGTNSSLAEARAKGADIRMVYSPLDAITIAERNPQRRVVFLAIGFETTAPVNALALLQAKQKQLANFSMLVSQVLVPPAIEKLLAGKEQKIDAFLAAGHVCTVMGLEEYERLAKEYKIPLVVTGFEPLDILQGIYHCLKQLKYKQAFAENQYKRVVQSQGNKQAQELINQVFTVTTQNWRGIGGIADSGLQLREKFRNYDAKYVFAEVILGKNSIGESNDLKARKSHISASNPNTECISGLILQGLKKPIQCPNFAKACTPEHPLGSPMVSNEGACAAYYLYDCPEKIC